MLPPTEHTDAVTDAKVADALLTASRALVGVAARSLAAVVDDVTLPQYRALVVLAARGPQTVGDLADAVAVHDSTATRLCDRLVAKKLVHRAVSRGNRRETVIRLTSEGRSIVDRVTTIRRAEIERIVGRIPPALRQPAVEALEAFSEASGELADQSWALGWS
jgi:DNA-binding MarR family transcriptional regulator